MKNGKMQAKDIPDEPILSYLAQNQGKWTMVWEITHLFPDGCPPKLIKAKMASIIRRGLSGGCECGCRGDFEITDKGLAVIGAERTHEYGGY